MTRRITLDLTKHPAVFERIAETAQRENRSLARQLLHEVLPVLTNHPQPTTQTMRPTKP